jgi:hypothetical protein
MPDRNPLHGINRLTLALESTIADPMEARQRLAADAARDVAPVPFLAAFWVMMMVARHEAAHAWYAVMQGWRVPRTILRSDGTGVTDIEGGGTDYDTEIRRAVFNLVGLACDLREPYSDVSACYDLIAARARVDALNARAIGRPVRLQRVASNAVWFVDRHIRAIENIGLALYDARELDHYSVKLFGECGR